MKRTLLSLGLLLGLTLGAQAQCVGVGSVSAAPWPGMNCGMEPTVGTFAATGIGIVPAASATDIACLPGNASNVVRVQRVKVNGTAGTLVNVPVILYKRASANTGGTLATSTALPVAYRLDSTNSAPVSVPVAWTANPTIVDTSPGIISAEIVPLTATGTVAATKGIVFDWHGQRYAQAPVLRGLAQNLCVNFNAVSVSSGVVNVSFEWTEAAQ